ncbi:SHD1 domain-containing protein [Planctomycetaceae bacterium SH139]
MLSTLSLLVGPAWGRHWTSSDGRFRVQATLVGFDGSAILIQKADGKRIEVPINRLCQADREYLWTQIEEPQFAATIPADLREFRNAMESMRAVEVRRIERRLENLRKQLRSGARDTRHPLLREAKGLIKQLGQWLELLKSGAAFVPTISPKDFRVGQIGRFDDDLQFSIGKADVGKERKISISFFEYRHIIELPGARNNWHVRTISRPDLVVLKADFSQQLPETRLDRRPNAPANRLLRAHVYRVVDVRPRGGTRDFVLSPFPMDDIRPMLAD